MQDQRLGLAGALAAGLAWGAMFPVLANLLKHLDPFWLTSIRYAGASIVLLLILLVVEGRPAFRLEGRGLQLAVLGTCGIAVFNIFVLEGMRSAGPEHGGLIVALGPLFTALILWIRDGVRPARVTQFLILLAFAGVALVVTKGNPLTLLHGGSAGGDVLIALGVLGVTYYTIGAAGFRDWSWLRFTALSIAFGTLTTLLATAFGSLVGLAHVPSGPVDAATVSGMAYMIFIAAVLAFIAWNLAVAKIGPQNAVLFMNAVPVVTFIIEFALGQRFAVVEYAGAAMTIAALVLNNVATRPRVERPAVIRCARPSTSSR